MATVEAVFAALRNHKPWTVSGEELAREIAVPLLPHLRPGAEEAAIKQIASLIKHRHIWVKDGLLAIAGAEDQQAEENTVDV